MSYDGWYEGLPDGYDCTPDEWDGYYDDDDDEEEQDA